MIFADNNYKYFYYILSPHFSNTMLYAVLFIQLDWKYAGVGEGNLFFFSGGEKREGKSSFADMGFGVGKAVCKCAFTVAVGFLDYVLNKVAGITKQDRSFMNKDTSFIL